MKHIILIFLTSTVLSVFGSPPIIKDNGADFVDAGFKRATRRGGPTVDLTKIEVKWQPFAMIEDKASVDMNNMKVGLKTADGEWEVQTAKISKRGGGKFRMVIDDILPCKDHYVQFIFSNPEGEETVYEYPNVISAASKDELATSSDFTPETPASVAASAVNENIEISWEPVECATSYEITYKKILDDESSIMTVTTETNSVILSDGIDTCSEYEVFVSAVTGEAYSDSDSIDIFTPPAGDAASRLTPSINAGTSSVDISWEGWEKLACVKEYEVKICEEDGECFETEIVKREFSLPNIVYAPTLELNKCSGYDFFLKPLFDNNELEEVNFPFKTLSPKVDGISDLLKPVIATAGDEQMTKISWSPVECAVQYEIFQHIIDESGDWETIGTSTDNELSIKGVPCTEYRYGVKVTIDDQISEIVEADETVITHLPSHTPYSAPNLIISPDINGAEISWDHALCISSYRLAVCDSNKENCVEKEIIIEETSQHNVTWMIEDLNPCSEYVLEVFATSNEQELDAEPHSFSTLAPPSSPPENVVFDKSPTGSKMDISFDNVKCASLYHVHQKINEGDFEKIHEISEAKSSIEVPDACTTYSVGLSSVVDGVESEVSVFHEDKVPPVEEEKLMLKIKSRANESVILHMKLPASNQNCMIEKYHMKYKNLEDNEEKELFLDSSEVENGEIILDDFSGDEKKGIFIEGRIKYADFDVWSPWTSTAEKVAADPLNSDSSSSTLIPIIIGVLVALIIVAILIFFVVKKRNSDSKYQGEKVDDAEEKKNLKDHSAV